MSVLPGPVVPVAYGPVVALAGVDGVADADTAEELETAPGTGKVPFGPYTIPFLEQAASPAVGELW